MPYSPVGRAGKPRSLQPREKIQASQLINRLQDHIFGRLKTPLDISQVRAIDILLKKVVPDLTRTLISADVNVRYVAHLPEPISREAWLKKYGGDYLDPGSPRIIDGTTNGSGGNGSSGSLQ